MRKHLGVECDKCDQNTDHNCPAQCANKWIIVVKLTTLDQSDANRN